VIALLLRLALYSALFISSVRPHKFRQLPILYWRVVPSRITCFFVIFLIAFIKAGFGELFPSHTFSEHGVLISNPSCDSHVFVIYSLNLSVPFFKQVYMIALSRELMLPISSFYYFIEQIFIFISNLLLLFIFLVIPRAVFALMEKAHVKLRRSISIRFAIYYILYPFKVGVILSFLR